MQDYRNYIGRSLDQLKLEKVLGVGGNGAVFLARHQIMDTIVAVKILPPHLAVDDTYKERFFREAREVAKLSHDHIVKVMWMGESADGLLFLSMEFMGGGNVGDIVERDGKIEIHEAIRLIVPVADALQYAHEQGLVHRDIKPDNLLLTDGQPPLAKVADFGLVRNLQGGADQQNITRTGEAIGTPAFMPLEQWDGLDIDARVDVYALGITFYYMVSGQLPIQEEGISAIVSRLLTGGQTPLPKVCPECDEDLWAIVRQAIAPQRNHRTGSVKEFGEALRAWSASRGDGNGSMPDTMAQTVELPPPASIRPSGSPTGSQPPVDDGPGMATLPRRRGGIAANRSVADVSAPAALQQSQPGAAAPSRVAPPPTPGGGGSPSASGSGSGSAADIVPPPRGRRGAPARPSAPTPPPADDWDASSSSRPGGLNRSTFADRKAAPDRKSPASKADRPERVKSAPGDRAKKKPQPSHPRGGAKRSGLKAPQQRRAPGGRPAPGGARRPSGPGPRRGQAPLVIGIIAAVGVVLAIALLIGATSGDDDAANNANANANANASADGSGNDADSSANGSSNGNASDSNASANANLPDPDDPVNLLVEKADRARTVEKARVVLAEVDSWIKDHPGAAARLADARVKLRRILMEKAWDELIEVITFLPADATIRRNIARNHLQKIDAFLSEWGEEFPELEERLTEHRANLEEEAGPEDDPGDTDPPDPVDPGDARPLPAPDPALRGPLSDAVRHTPGQTEGPYRFQPNRAIWFGFELSETRRVQLAAQFTAPQLNQTTFQQTICEFYDHQQNPLPDVPGIDLAQRTQTNDAVLPAGRYYVRVWTGPIGAGTVRIQTALSDPPAHAHPGDALEVQPGTTPSDEVAFQGQLFGRLRIRESGWFSTGVQYSQGGDPGVVVSIHRVVTAEGAQLYVPYANRTCVPNRQQNFGVALPFEPGEYVIRTWSRQYNQACRAAFLVSPMAPIEVPDVTSVLPDDYRGGQLDASSRLQPGEYTIEETITVPDGACLVIDAGVTLRFAPGAGVLCNGILQAHGKANSPIRFERAGDQRWGNVTVWGSDAGLSLRHVSISGGGGQGYRAASNATLTLDPASATRFGGGLVLMESVRLNRMVDCTIEDCSVAGNGGLGGGLFVGFSALDLERVSVRTNEALEGGGIVLRLVSAMRMDDCEVSRNRTTGSAGAAGILAFQQSLLVAHKVRITDNQATGANSTGGGLRIQGADGSLWMTDSAIEDNEAFQAGGAFCRAATATFERCVFRGNRAQVAGGGLLVFETTVARVVECDFQGNEAGTNGGGAAVGQGYCSFENTRFDGNTAQQGAGLLVSVAADQGYRRLPPSRDAIRRGIEIEDAAFMYSVNPPR